MKELFKLIQEPLDPLDKLIVGWNLEEIKKAFQRLLKDKNDTIKSLEEAENLYIQEMQEKVKKAEKFSKDCKISMLAFNKRCGEYIEEIKCLNKKLKTKQNPKGK